MAYFMKYLRQFDKQIGAFKLAVSISVLGKDFKLGYLFLISPFTGVMFYAWYGNKIKIEINLQSAHVLFSFRN